MKIGFIGVGNMGGALAAAAAKNTENEVLVFDIDSSKAKTVANNIGARYNTLQEICQMADYIFLGVKPQVLDNAILEIKNFFDKRNNVVLVSMAAGVSIDTITEKLGKDYPIIRIMPNMPVSVGEGMTVYSVNSLVTKEQTKNLVKAMVFSGKWEQIEETLIDAATAVSGCGPAFVFEFIKAFIEAGINCGLNDKQAREFAIQTTKGATCLLEKSDRTADDLIDAVCSPAGSTIEGVKILRKNNINKVIKDTVAASFNRTVEMGKNK